MIHWDFPSIPLILVITLQNKKPLFCVFLLLRDLPGLKLTCNFLGINILPREAPRGEEVNETRHMGQTSTGGAGPWPGRATLAFFGPRASATIHLRLQMLSLT
jgi:hypothetical protein